MPPNNSSNLCNSWQLKRVYVFTCSRVYVTCKQQTASLPLRHKVHEEAPRIGFYFILQIAISIFTCLSINRVIRVIRGS